ncbi:MAG: hypothetical protein KDE50_05970 [Caldilineaceae bacterium]|nr:hypothetical protein [Caldilineaceae bacterium]
MNFIPNRISGLAYMRMGLSLHTVKRGGAVDWEQRKWLPEAPLGKAMNYVAHMKKEAIKANPEK